MRPPSRWSRPGAGPFPTPTRPPGRETREGTVPAAACWVPALEPPPGCLLEAPPAVRPRQAGDHRLRLQQGPVLGSPRRATTSLGRRRSTRPRRADRAPDVDLVRLLVGHVVVEVLVLAARRRRARRHCCRIRHRLADLAAAARLVVRGGWSPSRAPTWALATAFSTCLSVAGRCGPASLASALRAWSLCEVHRIGECCWLLRARPAGWRTARRRSPRARGRTARRRSWRRR